MTVWISQVGKALVAGGMIMAAGCATEATPSVQLPPPEVTVAKPITREVTDYFEFPGQTAAVGEVEVRARVTGYIVKVNFKDGQQVKEGDLLFEIDPRPYQAALDRTVGELARIEALLAKAKKDLVRSERLRPSGAVSEDDYELHLSQLAVHQASLQVAQAAKREAELNLGFTNVVSPINGRVSNARIREGNLVQPGPGDTTVLTTVVTTDPIYVYFNIDEQALLKYVGLAGQRGEAMHPSHLKDKKISVEIGLGHEEGFPHVGMLDFADNKLDSQTGTIRARGIFENTKEYLTPGLFCRVRIPFGKPHPALLVSDRAIGTDQRQKYLLTVNQQNVVQYHQVKLGPLQDGQRVIESGIGPDDWVIVKGLQRARPGSTVKPHPAEDTTAATASTDAKGKPDQASAGRKTTH